MEPRIALPPTVSPVALRRCDSGMSVSAMAGSALGTTWRVRLVAHPATAIDRLRATIDTRLADIVAEMSQWKPDSLLSRFNRAPAGTWMTLPPDFATVLATALAIAERSDGAFDPTHGRAAALLGHGAMTVAGAPTAAALDEARVAAGWRRLVWEPGRRRLRQPGGLWLDFSGIAKGFAVDAVADLLREQGFDDVLVDIGGELVGRGLRPDGRPWWVDAELPPGIVLPPLRIGLHDQAVATSGDYVRRGHTIDPGTGRSLASDVASVSVIHASAMLADAWATALTVQGPVAALATATRDRLAVRIVRRERGRASETLSPALHGMTEG
ncbi:FAD:protein FMN transferase [Sphingomonas bacterium]|uniref:FAD:protein FMN transferase n=1 Tax=Sphingomonas bacterium TaxID=1895847 RepID=UPI001577729C|nr:FAD:protein FMN transferase [Sphingomonas bacterium]